MLGPDGGGVQVLGSNPSWILRFVLFPSLRNRLFTLNFVRYKVIRTKILEQKHEFCYIKSLTNLLDNM